MRPPAGPARLWLIVAGFSAWGVAFVALYGAQAVGCRLGWHETAFAFGLSLQRAALVVLFLALLGGVAALAKWLASAHDDTRTDGAADAFLGKVGRDAGLAALAATALSFAWVFFLTAC